MIKSTAHYSKIHQDSIQEWSEYAEFQKHSDKTDSFMVVRKKLGWSIPTNDGIQFILMNVYSMKKLTYPSFPKTAVDKRICKLRTLTYMDQDKC